MKLFARGHRLRTFVAGAAAGLLLLSGGLAHARSTSAFDVWCYDDPIILVDGVPQSITVGIPQSDVGHLIGPVIITVEAPSGHSVTLGAPLPGPFQVVAKIVPSFNPYSTSPVVHTTTFVPADARFNVTVTAVDGSGQSKTSSGQSWMPIRLDFNPHLGK